MTLLFLVFLLFPASSFLAPSSIRWLSHFGVADPTILRSKSIQQSTPQRRPLGSLETLFLPRQYWPSSFSGDVQPPKIFSPINHVCRVKFKPSDKVSVDRIQTAILGLMSKHLMLRTRVVGQGRLRRESGRVDSWGLDMVRGGIYDGDNREGGSEDTIMFELIDGDDRELELERIVKENVVSIQAGETVMSVFTKSLDSVVFDNARGPLWKIVVDSENCEIVFVLNHAVSDQKSLNVVVTDILESIAGVKGVNDKSGHHGNDVGIIPAQLETSLLSRNDAVYPDVPRWKSPLFFANQVEIPIYRPGMNTLKYLVRKGLEVFKRPVVDLDGVGSSDATRSSDAVGDRETIVTFREFDDIDVVSVVDACRANAVKLTSLLGSVTVLTTSLFHGSEKNPGGEGRNYKLLQSMDWRRFCEGENDKKAEVLRCMAGSIDLIIGPVSKSVSSGHRDALWSGVWDYARQAHDQTSEFVSSGCPLEAVRVFDFGMRFADITNLVDISSRGQNGGRVYSCGISNAGSYNQDGVEGVYFATSQANAGSIFQVSCLTVNGKMLFTFQAASPVVDKDTLRIFADKFGEILRGAVGGGGGVSVGGEKGDEEGVMEAQQGFSNAHGFKKAQRRLASTTSLMMKNDNNDSSSKSIDNKEGKENEIEEENDRKNILSTVTMMTIPLAFIPHLSAWSHFAGSVQEMYSNLLAENNLQDFWSAANFWLFFAFGHAVLQPVLFLSELLHASPGPKVLGDLVPISFLAGNVAFIGILAAFKEVRNALNALVVSALIFYIGNGLNGTGGFGDYNLQLNDDYQGQVVKGCPAYEDVRQPSMDDFNLEKYEGKWYEHEFHDWTQFKEVYDTSLDIKLTNGGREWVDDFGLRGPSPKSNPRSWDKSPVANGAHYFLFGRVDDNDSNGVLRERGFGVEFPNYIVDVKKGEDGEYKESIQFQCLEKGGVRVFEGINYLSKSPTMTKNELDSMHTRARAAGMDKYGAGVDQTHTNEFADGLIDNNWQKMWHTLGVDRLLELLTKAIEDGGRE